MMANTKGTVIGPVTVALTALGVDVERGTGATSTAMPSTARAPESVMLVGQLVRVS